MNYDSTANALEYGDNGTNRTVANLEEAQTFTNKTLTAANNAVEADDLICTDCIGPTEITDLTLGTDTAGNFIQSLTSGTGLTGFPAAAEQATGTPALDFSQTLAGNPAFNLGEAVFTDDCTGGGFLSEGATANTNEMRYCFPALDEADTIHELTTNTATQTLTGKTYDAEAAGNALTITSEIVMIAAGCDNATAAKGLDIPTANGPTATCFGTAPDRFAYLDFADGAAALTASGHFRLPTGWTGNVDLNLYWACSAATCSTNNVSWNIQTVCVANGEDWLNPTYNALQEIVDAGLATLHLRNEASQNAVTTTGCAAEETFFFQINRDPTDTSDTFAGTAGLLEIVWTLRRTI